MPPQPPPLLGETDQLPQRSGPSLPFFRQPSPEEIPTPASSPEVGESPAADPFDAPPSSGPGWDESPESPAESAPPSSPGSATRAAGNPLVGAALRDTFRNGVIIASDQASRFLARSAGQREVGLYVADTDDAAHIGDPLARMAARRESLGEMSEDTADVLAAMMGLAGYAAKQITKREIAAKIDARRGPEEVQTFEGPEVAA